MYAKHINKMELYCLDQSRYDRIQRRIQKIYEGKVNKTVKTQLEPRVTKDLTKCLFRKHYFVCFEKYFTSMALLGQLRTENIHTIGTIRKNRKEIPRYFQVNKELKRGNFDWCMTHFLSRIEWVEKKIVLLTSTCENTIETDNVVKDNSEMENVSCPKILKNYITIEILAT